MPFEMVVTNSSQKARQGGPRDGDTRTNVCKARETTLLQKVCVAVH